MKIVSTFLWILFILAFQATSFFAVMFVIGLQISQPITPIFIFFDIIFGLFILAPCFVPQKWEDKKIFEREVYQFTMSSVLLLLASISIYQHFDIAKAVIKGFIK